MKSIPTNLQTPQVGRPLTRSWVESVTRNMNIETPTPGLTEGVRNVPAAPAPYVNPLMLRVKNTTESQQSLFAVLHVSDPEFEDSPSFPELLRSQQNELLGTLPTGEENEKICITSYYADPDMVVPCVVEGPTPVKILFPDAASLEYPYAISINGDATQLKASPYGWIRILWHEDPPREQSGCDSLSLFSWVNMGEDGQWVFFKLQGDLPCCGSTTGLLVDECGVQIGQCPIIKTVWAPTPHDEDAPVCTCDTGESLNTPPSEADSGCWKEGDILPFWWYQYLDEGRGKWVTIPKEQTGGTGPWSLVLAQAPQLVCQEGLDDDGNTVCTGALVIPRKRLTVDGGCACLADEQSLALTLPTPDLLGVPTLTIDTGDATGADDDPCTCNMATLEFPVTPMSWCDGCAPDGRTESVTFPVPPSDGGRLSPVTSVTLSAASACGSVNLCYTTQDYNLVCGGLCADGSATEHCLDVQLFETESIEYVTGVTLSDIQLDVTGTPTTVVTGVTLDTSAVALATTDVTVVTDVSLVPSGFALATTDVAVVTGGSVSVSSATGHTSYDRATGMDWTGVTWSVTLPTTTKTVVTGISVSGCDINVTTETITVIDPDGTPTIMMTGTPTITHTSTALSMTFTPSVSFVPTTQTLHLPTGITVASGALAKTTQTLQIPTGITVPSTALSVTTGSVNSVTGATATGGTFATTTEQKNILLCPAEGE